MTTNVPELPERRRRRRFDLDCQLLYRLLDSRRHLPQQPGKMIDMSSKGVLFETSSQLPVGKRVELSISWPAKLNEKCGLKMIGVARVVRSTASRAAVALQKHEFKTQSVVAIVN
jgi:hypothetical protein